MSKGLPLFSLPWHSARGGGRGLDDEMLNYMMFILSDQGQSCTECGATGKPTIHVQHIYLCSVCLMNCHVLLRDGDFSHLPAKDRMNAEMSHRGQRYKSWYREYLNSEHWFDLRDRKIAQMGGEKCEVCGSLSRICCHHLRYKNVYDVELEDLQLLCRSCHEKTHGIKSPNIKVDEGL